MILYAIVGITSTIYCKVWPIVKKGEAMTRIRISIVGAILLTATSGLLAEVKVSNLTDAPIKVEIYYTGIGSPAILEIGPKKSDICKKDLANIKTGYVVWVKDGGEYRKVISEQNLKDLGAFRKLVVQKIYGRAGYQYTLARSGN